MKLGICNEIFGGWPDEKVFSFVSGLGYAGIEIAPFTYKDSVEDISAETRVNIKELGKKYKVDIIGSHWLLAKPEGLSLSTADRATRERTAGYLCRLAEFTHETGGELMVLGSPKQRSISEGQDFQEVKRNFVETLSPALEVCRRKNVDICLEPLTKKETNFINTAQEAINIIEEVNHPNLKLHLDVKAMSSENRTIPEIISGSKKYLRHFHVNDPNMMYPGSGEVDFAPIIEALKEAGYSGWLSLEVFDFSHGPEKIAEASIRYLKKLM